MNKRIPTTLVALSFLSIGLAGCGPKDENIQKDLNQAAVSSQYLAGKSFSVTDGVATVTGTCPDDMCRTRAEEEIKRVKGVKSVVNNIIVEAPVAMPDPGTMQAGPDITMIMNGMKDATKDFPSVTYTVNNGVIVLNGTISRNDLPVIMQRANALKPVRVENNLTIK